MNRLLLLGAIAATLAFKSIEQVNNHTATVNQEQGLFLFIESKPAAPHDYMGTVAVSVSWSGKYDEVKSILLKNAKKKYPNADGLIIDIENGKADAIKFKNDTN